MRLFKIPVLLLLAGCLDKPSGLNSGLRDMQFSLTPAGHVRSVGIYHDYAGRVMSDAQIDQAVDDGYAAFKALYPLLTTPVRENCPWVWAR